MDLYGWILMTGVLLALNVTCNVAAPLTDPVSIWPLSNVSLYNDVMASQNMLRDNKTTCFAFVAGPKDLPYKVIEKKSLDDSCFDVNLQGASPFHDLTISMYVFPNNDESDISGTILHYQSDNREIMRIRTLANTFLVSFRDEYGMSAGMMYLVSFLTPHAWNHVTISRDFQTGKIIVYKNGIELYNDDDEFSDVISFPHAGKLRIGKSQDPNEEDLFDGNIACIQIYHGIVTKENQASIAAFCQPEKWRKTFHYYYQEINGHMCLTEPTPKPVKCLEIVGGFVTMATLTSEPLWQSLLMKYNLHDSGKISGYLQLVSLDRRPVINDNLIGCFNITEIKLCARLCVRIDGCQSILVNHELSSNIIQCILYDDESSKFVSSEGSKFYIFKN